MSDVNGPGPAPNNPEAAWLKNLLDGRDDFIVSRGLWQDFVDQLPPTGNDTSSHDRHPEPADPAEADYTVMPEHEMLTALGTDASKWATAFRQMALKLGYSAMDDGWLIGWFANAIEHSSAVRLATLKAAGTFADGRAEGIEAAARLILDHDDGEDYSSKEARRCERLARLVRWQPMDSAPKDGTDILLADEDGWMAVAQWWVADWAFMNNRIGDMPALIGFKPTVWQPLPAPPQES